MAGVTLGDSLKVAARVLGSTRTPMLAHLVVTRYCNLDCAYCSEFDKVSKPVPIAELLARVDALAALGTQIVTLTGGEPLTHPDHDAVIRRIRHHGMVATTITNGFLLTEEKIAGMNAAGLQEMQISIDGVKPDEISKKTLKSLAGKLKLLSEHADLPRQHQLGARRLRGAHLRGAGGGARGQGARLLPHRRRAARR